MRKTSAILGSLAFLVIAPGTVAGALPWWISGWHLPPLHVGAWLTGVGGSVLIAGGLLLLFDSFARFALTGLGTPAPVAPPKHLVVSGWYRHVRNPMYAALLALIFGQALLFANAGLLLYGAIVWISFYVFVVGYEEPTLRRTFGEDYAQYCAHVPRWIPKLRSWSPGQRLEI